MASAHALGMKKLSTLAVGVVLSSALFAGCGGSGGGSSATPFNPGGGAQATPTPASVATPTPTSTPAAAAALATANVNGSPGFVTSSGMATYFFGGDTVAGQSTCTGGCLAIWPAVAAPAGTLSAPWSSFKRADNGVVQIAYNGKPIYSFVDDTTPGVATGDGFQNFHIARPDASNPTPTPTPAVTPTPYNYTAAKHRSH